MHDNGTKRIKRQTFRETVFLFCRQNSKSAKNIGVYGKIVQSSKPVKIKEKPDFWMPGKAKFKEKIVKYVKSVKKPKKQLEILCNIVYS